MAPEYKPRRSLRLQQLRITQELHNAGLTEVQVEHAAVSITRSKGRGRSAKFGLKYKSVRHTGRIVTAVAMHASRRQASNAPRVIGSIEMNDHNYSNPDRSGLENSNAHRNNFNSRSNRQQVNIIRNLLDANPTGNNPGGSRGIQPPAAVLGIANVNLGQGFANLNYFGDNVANLNNLINDNNVVGANNNNNVNHVHNFENVNELGNVNNNIFNRIMGLRDEFFLNNDMDKGYFSDEENPQPENRMRRNQRNRHFDDELVVQRWLPLSHLARHQLRQLPLARQPQLPQLPNIPPNYLEFLNCMRRRIHSRMQYGNLANLE